MKLDFLEKYPPDWQKQVHKYLAGDRREFDIKPKLTGTEFQMAVWCEIACIPYGQTRTYTEVAAAIGKPKAVRAVGTACGRNPFPIIVPCHRVVAQHGLGGYIFGLDMKKQLLDMERQNAK